MVLIQKSHKTVADVGTDPMDGHSMVRPHYEDAVIGSVIGPGSHSHRQLTEHIGEANIVSPCICNILSEFRCPSQLYCWL